MLLEQASGFNDVRIGISSLAALAGVARQLVDCFGLERHHGRSASPGSRILQSVPIWIGALLLFRSPDGVLATPIVLPFAWMHALALLLAALGFALTWWARIHLGRMWSGAVTLKEEHAPVRSGPYALMRHPIYTGLLLAVLATALDRDTFAAVLGFGLILLGLFLKLRQEEGFLRSKFGIATMPTRRTFLRSSRAG